MTLLESVKSENQDFEWYPTTGRMLGVISKDLKIACMRKSNISILDVGAGDGSALETLNKLAPNTHYKLYAIEKSQPLIKAMSPDIFIVGTDFHQQNLIDKAMDVVFCNPPYSEYAIWAEKLILESNADVLYLVIPERWESHQGIQEALKSRGTEAEVLGTDSFIDSEFRRARANVSILKIQLQSGYLSRRGDHQYTSPFRLWFDSNFKIEAEVAPDDERLKERATTEKLAGLTTKKDLVKQLVEYYQIDFEHLLNNYKALERLDPVIMKELDINVAGVRESLEVKIRGLKNTYWRTLFNNLDAITDRLMEKSRNEVLTVLFENTSIDFSISNAYSVIIWAIKNANKYFDKQLTDMYYKLSDSKNVRNYKSNHRIIEDGWRYSKSDMDRYTLDYRLIHDQYRAIFANDLYSFEFKNNLHESAHNLIGDVCTIAKNLGFDVIEKSMEFEWESGKINNFYCTFHGKKILFAAIKAYKNGNVHFKFNQEFMKKFNIEAGRLNNWIKTPQEAAEEMDLPVEEVMKHMHSNLALTVKNVPLLT